MDLSGFAEEVGDSGPVGCRGGGTNWKVGGTLDDGARLVTAPTGIVALDPAEMTVRVAAGTRLDELAGALAAHGQRVNLNGSPAATVGGTLAVGRSGLDRLGRGPMRDTLLEVTFVSSDGHLVKAGGPTVKNATGYDLARLFVGSLGTLGFAGEVVLRSNPAPAVSVWVTGPVGPDDVRARVHRPHSVLWDGTTCWVLLAGRGVDVEADAELLREFGLVEVDAPPPLPPHRWSIPPRDVAGFNDHRITFVAEAGVGVVHATEPQPPRRRDPETEIVHRRIKEIFDPSGRMNPGRSVLSP